MPTVVSQLKQAIDNQDENAVKKILTENPGLDLNEVAPRISALWWALNPPKGKPFSRAIITCLLNTQKIDPTQRYGLLRLVDLIAEEPNFPLYQQIKSYEDQYVRPQAARTTELRDFVADDQNTHDSIIVKAVDSSISALYQRYGNSAFSGQTIENFIKGLKAGQGISEREIKAAQKACARIKSQTEDRAYALPANQRVVLTNQQVLNLLWQAVNDTRPESFVFNADMSTAEITARKRQLVKHLAMAQTEYGEDTAACWMGTRNQIVSSMDAVHRDVAIAESLPITEESIGYQYLAYSKRQLDELAANEPALFRDYVYYYALRGLPGGAHANEPIPATVQQWLAAAHDQFAREARAEYLNAKPEKQQINPVDFDSLLTRLRDPLFMDEDGELDPQLIPELKELGGILLRLFGEGLTLGDNLYGDAKAGLQEKIKEIIRGYLSLQTKMQAFVPEMLNDVVTCLQNAIDTEILKKYLLSSESRKQWQTVFDCLEPEHAEALLSQLKIKCIPLLLGHKPLTAFSNFWTILTEELTEKLGVENQIVQWFQTLPASLQERFIQQLFQTHGYPLTALSESLLVSEAFGLGLQEGYLSYLKSGQRITIRDKDLRGINLSTLDLTNIELINCDLRLTRLFNNKTITKAHIEENRLDDKYLGQLSIRGDIEALKFAISTKKAPEFFNEQLRGRNVFVPMLMSRDKTSLQRLVPQLFDLMMENPSVTAQHFARSGLLIYLVQGYLPDLIRQFIESPKCSTGAFRISEFQYWYARPREEQHTILHTIIWELYGKQDLLEKNDLLRIADLVLQSPHMKPEILQITNMGHYNVLSYAVSCGQKEMVLKILSHPHCRDRAVRDAFYHCQSDKRWNNKSCFTILNMYLNPRPSYTAIYQRTEGGELEKACALLRDYTKDNSAAVRFFCGHWNRHYIKEVNQVLHQIKNGKISTIERLITELQTIDPANKAGSLASRTMFIVREHKKALQAPVATHEPSINPQPHL
ncbi:DUF5617 domain-containing protein [Legionella dresdenensis]|uniref:DUF5617 domain-containing protein n=1 Tax=Legionella dresdenensis TaxID=450200 RepID=A0ABV8CG70_9GAMM